MEVKLIAVTHIDWDWSGDALMKEYSPHMDNGDEVMDADELAEMAGRLCYKSWERPNPLTAHNKGYLSNIISQGHFSVLEHASATFWIGGVSRSLTHELVRHRHLSFSQVSQRYVDESVESAGGGYVVHPALREWVDTYLVPDDQVVKEFDPSVGDIFDMVDRGQRSLYKDLVDFLVGKGVDRKTARGAARGVLPNMTETELIVSGNLRAWRDMLSKRLGQGADAEIRELAVVILGHLKAYAPNTFQDME